jgi:hypothetical protein
VFCLVLSCFILFHLVLSGLGHCLIWADLGMAWKHTSNFTAILEDFNKGRSMTKRDNRRNDHSSMRRLSSTLSMCPLPLLSGFLLLLFQEGGFLFGFLVHHLVIETNRMNTLDTWASSPTTAWVGRCLSCHLPRPVQGGMLLGICAKEDSLAMHRTPR